MSGHSKWHNIQGKKGKADKARSNVFTKLARMIAVTAREGGGDPVMNFSLRLAIDKAKAANMPKENIERAIKKGIGEDGDGATLQEALYEGFGPAGSVILVEALTDNPNRTVSEIKNVITKNGGTVGGAGSVKWQFNRLGVIRLSLVETEKIKNQKSEFELELMDAGMEDMQESEFGLEIHCPVEKFQAVLEIIKKFNLEPESSSLEWVAKELISLDEEASNRLATICDALDELDDVREVYTNEL